MTDIGTANGKASFGNLIIAETRKLVDTRASVWLLSITAALSLIIAGVSGWAVTQVRSGTVSWPSLVFFPAMPVNALLPVVTLAGVHAGTLIGGAVITEQSATTHGGDNHIRLAQNLVKVLGTGMRQGRGCIDLTAGQQQPQRTTHSNTATEHHHILTVPVDAVAFHQLNHAVRGARQG